MTSCGSVECGVCRRPDSVGFRVTGPRSRAVFNGRLAFGFLCTRMNWNTWKIRRKVSKTVPPVQLQLTITSGFPAAGSIRMRDTVGGPATGHGIDLTGYGYRTVLCGRRTAASSYWVTGITVWVIAAPCLPPSMSTPRRGTPIITTHRVA